MTDQEQKIQDRAARVKRLSNNEKLLAAFAAMETFPDGTAWPGSGHKTAGVLPWWKQDHTDAEYKEMAQKLVGHPVWDMTIGDLTEEEQKLGRSRGMVRNVWAYANDNRKMCEWQANIALKRMRTQTTIDMYSTVYARLCKAITDVLENRWPKLKTLVDNGEQESVVVQPIKPVPTCQMHKVNIDGHTVSQGPCGKPVHTTAPNRAGLWYCEECVATLMEGPNGNFQERKKAEIDQIKHDLDRPFKPRYLIGTGDLHGPKL